MLHREKNRQPLTRLGWGAAALVALGVSLPLAAAGAGSPTPLVTPASLAEAEVTAPQQAPQKASPPLTVELKPTAPRPAPAAAPRPAQAGSVTGRVTDQSGGALPGATITLTDRQTKSQQTAVTSAVGRFTFANLPPGEYELMAHLVGFRAVVSAVSVSSGNAADQTITLPIGIITETITVQCTAPSASIFGALFPVLHAQTPMTPVRIGGQINVPKKVTHVAPVCPAEVPAGKSTVVLTGTMKLDGSVEPDPAQSGAQPMDAMFGAVADAMRQWMFTPAKLNGQAVEVTIKVTVIFTK